MLVLTIQKKEIADKIMSGTYKANFFKSMYGCISPGYTKGYMLIKKALERKLNTTLLVEDSPIWGWVGTPYLEFHKYTTSEKLVAMFIDVPDSRVVVSDYDKFCDYIEGRSNNSNFIVNDYKEEKGVCLQASFMGIKPEEILLVMDYRVLLLDEGAERPVERIYNSIRFSNLYYSLKKKSIGAAS